jgi:putative protease
MTLSPKPEILAPVGSMDMCRAAVAAGANAVYLGLPGFNARGRAPVLTYEELEEILTHAHSHGVKVFAALNVLIFQNELEDVISRSIRAAALGIDAFIVQDIGLARLLRAVLPEILLHASTQMTITSAEAIAVTESLGMTRYVLGREVSIPELTKIRESTDKELEVFVHGALCVSYSGQCLTSERVGGRSANRGQCAQSCRWPYTLVVDGVDYPVPDKRYFVSPKDLNGTESVPDLMKLGINSFKIEGRLKSPSYVASTTFTYRSLVDATTTTDLDLPFAIQRVMENGTPAIPMEGKAPEETNKYPFKQNESSDNLNLHGYTSPTTEELQIIFSRGSSTGWQQGVNHQTLVDGRFGNHHGTELGRIDRITTNGIELTLNKSGFEPERGDGVVICDFSDDTSRGAQIYGVKKINNSSDAPRYLLSIEPNHSEWLTEGMSIFINARPRLERHWERFIANHNAHSKLPLTVVLKGAADARLEVEFSLPEQRMECTVYSEDILAAARRAPLTTEFLRDEFASLSHTPFVLTSFENQLTGDLFLHHKALKLARRKGVETLITLLTRPATINIEERRTMAEAFLTAGTKLIAPENAQGLPYINVTVRSPEQLEELYELPIDTIYLDFEFEKQLKDAVVRVRELGYKCAIATTRIYKPGEQGHLKFIARLQPDAVLVRNLGALQYLKQYDMPLVGDFSLNSTNSLTHEWLIQQGLQRIVPSFDLNEQQLLDLVRSTSPDELEITIHHYMPAFHMEHCVFAATLSNGTSFRDCGRPCEKHRVELRDPDGNTHALKPDSECRNTMYYGIAQTSGKMIPRLRKLGITNFRIEALYEESSNLREKILTYADISTLSRIPDEALLQVNAIELCGVNDGQLFKIRSGR